MLRPEETGDELGRPVVIGHVEGRQARIHVWLHRGRRAIQIDRAAVTLHVGKLPEPGEHTRNGEIRRKVRAGNRRRHGLATRAATRRTAHAGRRRRA
jgi:hypothetical protein